MSECVKDFFEKIFLKKCLTNRYYGVIITKLSVRQTKNSWC